MSGPDDSTSDVATGRGDYMPNLKRVPDKAVPRRTLMESVNEVADFEAVGLAAPIARRRLVNARRSSSSCALAANSLCLRPSGSLCSGPRQPKDHEGDLLTLRVGAVGSTAYWLFLEANPVKPLSSLDAFLRSIWLECCGHLSMFSISGLRYSPAPSDLLRLRGRPNVERSMASPIGAVFSQDGRKGTYEYDFGSTKELSIERVSGRVGRVPKAPVRLLARNALINWTCAACGAPATLVCCVHETQDNPFVCDAHASGHGCEDEAFLPVVNSPRMGICGYGG